MVCWLVTNTHRDVGVYLTGKEPVQQITALANETAKLEYEYTPSADTIDYNDAYIHDDNHHTNGCHHLPEELRHVIHFQYEGRTTGGIMIRQEKVYGELICTSSISYGR